MTRYTSHSDRQLICLLREGDQAAFSEIYHRYWDKLFYWATKRLGDLAEAENQVQDVFTDLWHRRKDLDITGELNSYLAVALKYRIINTQARQYRSDEYRRYSRDHLPAQGAITEQDVAFEELKSRLATLVRRLPEQCRLAYQLREEGLSQKEIAREMQISEHTVERHISRALHRIRKGLAYLFTLLA